MPVPTTFDRVAVIGNGIIGHGVAQVYAVAGKTAVLIGRSDESLARAVENIRASLADFTRHGLVTDDEAAAALGRITHQHRPAGRGRRAAGDRGRHPRPGAEARAVRRARPDLPAAGGACEHERLACQRGARARQRTASA